MARKKKNKTEKKEKKTKFATIVCRNCWAYAGQFDYTDKENYKQKVAAGVRKYAVDTCEKCGNGEKFLIVVKGKTRDTIGVW